MQPSFLFLPNNRRMAYHLTEGKLPCVIFMGGFKSDMQGGKALALEAFCKSRGQRFLRFDYTGHGQSSGEFKDGTIGSWAQDAKEVVDALGAERNIIVGSSMGAWIAMLIARQSARNIAALVGIASAPDFTEKLIWHRLPAADQQKLMEEGVYHAPSCYGEDPYPITRALIEEGRKHLLLDAPLSIDVPVRLLHGTKDQDVPWQNSVTLMDRLSSADVRLTLVKDAGHRLSDPEHLELLCRTVEELLDGR